MYINLYIITPRYGSYNLLLNVLSLQPPPSSSSCVLQLWIFFFSVA